MDDITKYIIANVPNMIGFAMLSYVLYEQNKKLMAAVLDRLDELEEKVQALIIEGVSKK
jgi:hypothetical protein